MRCKPAWAATIAGAAILAGCQGGGEDQRQSMIDARVGECVEVFSKNGGAAAVGIDAQRICQCAVQKMTEGKSVAEIRAADKQTDPSPADVQSVGACVVEEAQRKGVIKK
jgi:hypothetical protein